MQLHKINNNSFSKSIPYKAGQAAEIKDMRTYWTFRDDMAVIDGVIMKGRRIVIPEAFPEQALQQLHINHMGIDKSKLLTRKSIYWIGMNVDIENHTKNALPALIFSNHSRR